MQFFARLEADSLAWRDTHFSASSWVAANSCFAGPDAEDAEATQLDALAGCQCLFEALKHRVDRRLCLGSGQARALDHMMDDVLFNQSGHLAGATVFDCTTLYRIDGIGFASNCENAAPAPEAIQT
jgi:hypothetical protein